MRCRLQLLPQLIAAVGDGSEALEQPRTPLVGGKETLVSLQVNPPAQERESTRAEPRKCAIMYVLSI